MMRGLELSEEAFQALMPFSFVTDREGRILHLGRSLAKIFPSLKPGSLYAEEFTLLRPNLGAVENTPSGLAGEFILIERQASRRERDVGIHLRGQVQAMSREAATFVFEISPAIGDAQQLSNWGLDFRDFSQGDPIFDFLLLVRMERNAKEKAQIVSKNLEWEVKIAKLLHRLTLQSSDLSEERAAFQSTIQSVCEELGWQCGHVYRVSDQSPFALTPTLIWYAADEERFRRFRETTAITNFKAGEGLPGLALEQKRIVWMDDVTSDPKFVRRKEISVGKPVYGVGVPVSVQGKIYAVMEFFSEREVSNRDNLTRFFEVLGCQVSQVVERQQAAALERERMAILAQSAKMASLGELAAGIAHEINNPLAVISMAVQLLDRMGERPSLESSTVLNFTARISRSIERISKIVEGLRMYSRDARQDAPQEWSVADIVQETLDLCRHKFDGRGLAVGVGELPKNLKMQCRPSQISQVLLNLLGNSFDAVQSTEAPWVKIETADCGAEVEIAVTDSGQGIPPDVADRILQPFFTTKPVGQGTGLGLSISAKIVADHHGRLVLDRSSANTRFVIRLPKKQPSALQKSYEALVQ